MKLIAVSTPSCRDPKWPYVMSLTGLLANLRDHEGNPVSAFYQLELNALVTTARNMMVTHAKKAGASHILWIDDDMAFPHDTIARLMAHNLPIVAANCTSRRPPVFTTAWKDGKRLLSKGKTGIEEVDAVGVAVALVEIGVFDALPEPWFDCPWGGAENISQAGEDMYFCTLARKHGFKIYVDHDLSQQIGHVGEMVYGHPMTEDAA